MTQDQRNGFVKLVGELRSHAENLKYGYSERSEYEEEVRDKIEKKSDLASVSEAAEKANQVWRRADEAKRRVEEQIKEEVSKLMREWDVKKYQDLNVFTLGTADILALDNADKASELVHRLSNL